MYYIVCELITHIKTGLPLLYYITIIVVVVVDIQYTRVRFNFLIHFGHIFQRKICIHCTHADHIPSMPIPPCRVRDERVI